MAIQTAEEDLGWLKLKANARPGNGSMVDENRS
jgi:hypothetical protein